MPFHVSKAKELNTSRIFALLTVLAVGAVILVDEPLLLGQGGAPPAPWPTSTYQFSANGLRLDLSIGSSSIGAGQPLLVQVGEYNPMPSPFNVTAGKSWALEGLRIDQCYASVYPFGVALYQGIYTAKNASEAKPLQIFPLVPCPLLIRLVNGYYFSPDSTNAVVLPGTSPSIPMSVNVKVSGTFSTTTVNGAAEKLSPGAYTVVAGDEWGTLAFLHFEVK